MKLNVTYINSETNSPFPGIRADEYANTRVIRYEARSSEVPDRFTVSVTVVADTADGRVFGPLVDFGGREYGMSNVYMCMQLLQ